MVLDLINRGNGEFTVTRELIFGGRIAYTIELVGGMEGNGICIMMFMIFTCSGRDI